MLLRLFKFILIGSIVVGCDSDPAFDVTEDKYSSSLPGDGSGTSGTQASGDVERNSQDGDGDSSKKNKKTTVDEVLNACTGSAKKSIAKELNFAARQDCSWGTVSTVNGVSQEVLSANGNLSIKDGWIRARELENVSLTMPTNVIVCGISLESKTDQIHFDDYFSFNLNNIVVASSKVLTDALQKDGDGHYIWDWPRIRDGVNNAGTGMVNKGKYCGTGNCELPAHDTAGNFSVGFSINDTSDPASDTNAALFAKISNKSKLNFTAVSTGDNDGGDCYHSGGQFDLTVSYVKK